MRGRVSNCSEDALCHVQDTHAHRPHVQIIVVARPTQAWLALLRRGEREHLRDQVAISKFVTPGLILHKAAESRCSPLDSIQIVPRVPALRGGAPDERVEGVSPHRWRRTSKDRLRLSFGTQLSQGILRFAYPALDPIELVHRSTSKDVRHALPIDHCREYANRLIFARLKFSEGGGSRSHPAPTVPILGRKFRSPNPPFQHFDSALRVHSRRLPSSRRGSEHTRGHAELSVVSAPRGAARASPSKCSIPAMLAPLWSPDDTSFFIIANSLKFAKEGRPPTFP